MKKAILATIMALTLTGCASPSGTAALVGGTIGYIVGTSQSTYHPHYIQPHKYGQRYVSPECFSYATYGERAACERGITQRNAEEQRRRENNAFRRSLGR